MNKNDIFNIINNLNTEDEIIEFVRNRINELEDNSRECTIGQGYTDSYNGYISSKVHYKAVASTKKFSAPDLVYDDMEPYISIVKEIKNKSYNELILFTTFFHYIYNYLKNDDLLGMERVATYMLSKKDKISIKEVKENECAFCSEKSGQVHNLFKFLGMDSQLITGYRNDEPHAFNIVYPNGYGNEPMFLYDVSHQVKFSNDEKSFSFGYFMGLNKEKYLNLMSGNPFQIDLTKTEAWYRKTYGLDDSFVFYGDYPKYIVGLEKKKEIDIEEYNYLSHQENGVESVDIKKR
ncbi:MAG TPA: hypothetical protein OIM63_02075 [Bacilli bacterium]|nr:hypothetical protein [Bacilli bacterium]